MIKCKRRFMHGKRRRRSPIQHKARYEHPESMHKDYPPKVMDKIKKENPNAIFEDPANRDRLV